MQTLLCPKAVGDQTAIASYFTLKSLAQLLTHSLGGQIEMKRCYRNIICSNGGNIAVGCHFRFGTAKLKPEIWITAPIAPLIKACIVAKLALGGDARSFNFIRSAVGEVDINQHAFWPASFDQCFNDIWSMGFCCFPWHNASIAFIIIFLRKRD